MKIINSLEDIDLIEAIIFFDLEYTCWGNYNVFNDWLDQTRPAEIIQMGFSYYNQHNNEISSVFSSYVKPKINPKLSSYCKTLLNIDQELIDNSSTLNDAVQNLTDWLNEFSENYVFSSWGSEDYYLFKDDCKRQNISNPLKNKSYLDLVKVGYDLIGLNDKKYMDREEVKKFLNIHKKDHTHEALQDSIELKDILQGLKDKFYYQALVKII